MTDVPIRSMTPITGDTIIDGSESYPIVGMYVGATKAILEYKLPDESIVRIDSSSLEFVCGLTAGSPLAVWRSFHE